MSQRCTFSANIDLRQAKKILVINLGGIGDLLLSAPALRALRDAYPHAVLELLVVPRAQSVARSLGFIDRVVTLDVDRPWRGSWQNIAALRALRRNRFDLAVNMRTLVSAASALKMRLVLALISPRVTAGRDTAGKGAFFDIRIPEEDAGAKYEMEYDIVLAEALGAPVRDRSVSCPVGQPARETVARLLQQAGVSDQDTLIGIHPGGRPSRRWPAGNFAGLMHQLRTRLSCAFIVTGSKHEHRLIEEIIRESGVSAINAAGKLDIESLAALLERCDLFISNDTGPLHIAAIVKTPLIGIFGPGCFKRYDPRVIFPKAVVLYRPSLCAPCNKVRCASLACLKAITVDEVFAAALRLLPPK